MHASALTAPLAALAAGLPAIIDLDADDHVRFDFAILGLAEAVDEERANVEMLAAVLPDVRFVPIPQADLLSAPPAGLFALAVTGFLTGLAGWGAGGLHARMQTASTSDGGGRPWPPSLLVC